jgi:hypothetical protein
MRECCTEYTMMLACDSCDSWYSMPDVEQIARIIRTVDGDNTLGAAELAERILEHIIKELK